MNVSNITVFWEQQGLQTFGQRIQITRPHASQPAFERHFAHLTEEYGGVHVVNLLGSKENETILTSAYGRHLHIARGVFGESLGITHFDFHNAVRIGGHDSVIRELRYYSHLLRSNRLTFCGADEWNLSPIMWINMDLLCAIRIPMK